VELSRSLPHLFMIPKREKSKRDRRGEKGGKRRTLSQRNLALSSASGLHCLRISIHSSISLLEAIEGGLESGRGMWCPQETEKCCCSV
jgi:hypothetical protein